MNRLNLSTATPRSVYFQVQLGLTDSQSKPTVSLNLSQRAHTPAGDFIAWFHYFKSRDLVGEISKVGQAWGYPHNGPMHDLRVRMSPDSIWSMCEQIALLPIPPRHIRERDLFIANLRKAAWVEVLEKEKSVNSDQQQYSFGSKENNLLVMSLARRIAYVTNI